MKSTALTCAIAAATLCVGSLAAAQDHTRRGDERQRYEPGAHQRYDGDQRAGSDRQWAARDGRRWEGRQQAYAQQRDHRVDGGGRGDYRADARYSSRFQQFHRGATIPYQYREHRYYVNDWRSHRLSAPPYGYQWVQDGSDYALIAIATGVIANLLINQ